MEATDEHLMSLIMEPKASEAPAEDDTPQEDVTDEATDEPEVQDDPAEDAGEDGEDTQADTDDDDPVKEEAAEQPTFTVKVDGEDREVTLDELTRSFSGQEYIQKRMQENATKAKEAEAVYSEFSAMRDQLAQLIQQVQAGELMTPPKAPDPALRDKDPVRYMRDKDAYDAARAEYEQQQQRLREFTQHQSEAQQNAVRVYRAEQMRELAAKMPDFADPEKGAVLARKLADAGQTYGFAPEEIGQVDDHRAILILHDAMKYRELQGQREKAAKKAEQARPIVKPGAQRPADSGKKKAKDALSDLRRTGSDEAALRWLMTPEK